ncbi:MAG: GTP pyrophosphokinase [Desulfobacteraceae bacterium]|nr:GTP pyrophosphokinase [Desulfobacteraceae bacterium]
MTKEIDSPRETGIQATALLEKALAIALHAHQGQKDKAGAPYILHPLRVMLRMETELEMIAAVLHDVVEDSGLTIEDLRREGMPEAALAAVAHLTRAEEESYEEFIERVKQNDIARKVKLADLEDNMNIKRMARPTEKDLARLKKYRRAWFALKGDQVEPPI